MLEVVNPPGFGAGGLRIKPAKHKVRSSPPSELPRPSPMSTQQQDAAWEPGGGPDQTLGQLTSELGCAVSGPGRRKCPLLKLPSLWGPVMPPGQTKAPISRC